MSPLLDINFNFGKFYLDEGGTHLIEVVIAVLTVFLTVIAQRIYDNYKRNEDLDSLYTHTKNQALEYSDAALKQSKALKELSNVIDAKQVEDFNIPLVSGFNSDLIKDWDSISFYLSIVSRRNAEQSVLISCHTKIKASLNGARRMEILIYKYVDGYNFKYEQTQNNWQSHVQNIGTFLNYFKAETHTSDYFIIKYDKIIHDWKNSRKDGGEKETSYVYENLVIPLRSLAKHHWRDIRAVQLEAELVELHGAYEEMRHLKERYSAWFGKTADKLYIMTKNLSDAFGEVDKTKKKNKIQIYAPTL